MASLTFERPHQLGLKPARDRMQRLADEMADQYRLKSEWQGDVLVFSRPGIQGRIEVTDRSILLQAKLGVMLSAFRPRIESSLSENFDAYFA
ncbi:MAG: polyhydroxyalkanoic acid system family protein [Burkholderiaceae bacterium]